jgi:hypothetical protein
MRILCLEKGDWVKPTDYPANGRDWEARLFTDFAINPNRRARETDYPINDANSPIKVVNFNGVGGSTIMYTALGAPVAVAGTLYQAMPAFALDSLSTSAASKSHSGENVPGSVLASFTASIISPCWVK